MSILTIDAIKVPNTKFMSYGIDKDGDLAFVYGHDTQRGAEMKTSRICNGNDKHWSFDNLKVVAWQEVTEKDFREGIKVFV